jgi:hypothetical protein
MTSKLLRNALSLLSRKSEARGDPGRRPWVPLMEYVEWRALEKKICLPLAGLGGGRGAQEPPRAPLFAKDLKAT